MLVLTDCTTARPVLNPLSFLSSHYHHTISSYHHTIIIISSYYHRTIVILSSYYHHTIIILSSNYHHTIMIISSYCHLLYSRWLDPTEACVESVDNRGRQRLRSSPGTGWIRIKIMINRNIKLSLIHI